METLKRYALALFSAAVFILAAVLLSYAFYLSNLTVGLRDEIDKIAEIKDTQTLMDQRARLSSLQLEVQQNEDLKAILLGIGSSLFSSLIFAFAYSWVVERINLEIVGKEVAESVRNGVYQQIKEKFIQVVPDDFFPSASEPDKKFNEILIKNLRSSGLYLFRGVTGRHIPGNLRKTDYSSFTTLKVLLLDPQNEGFLASYCEQRFGREADSAVRVDQGELVKEEIRMAITELHAISTMAPIQIAVHQGPIIYRTEIFDDTILVSFFSGSVTTAYPPTYQYAKDSIYYSSFLTDFNQAFENSRVEAKFDKNSNKEELREFIMAVFEH